MKHLTEWDAVIDSRDEDIQQETRLMFLRLKPKTEEEARTIFCKVRDAARWYDRKFQAISTHITQELAQEHNESKDFGPVYAAVQQLPRLQRSVLIARYVRNLSVQDIATFLHVNVRTVLRWETEAKAGVRKLMSDSA